jgi:hypothetical protein
VDENAKFMRFPGSPDGEDGGRSRILGRGRVKRTNLGHGLGQLQATRMLRSLLRFAWFYSVVSVFATIALLVDTWPHHPTSLRAWSFLFVIAFPVTVLGEWLAEGLLSNPLSAAVERRTARSRLSPMRIAYCLTVYVLLGICAVAIFYWATG